MDRKYLIRLINGDLHRIEHLFALPGAAPAVTENVHLILEQNLTADTGDDAIQFRFPPNSYPGPRPAWLILIGESAVYVDILPSL